MLNGVDGLLVVVVHLLLRHHLILIEVEGQLQLVGLESHVVISVEPFLDALHLLHLLLGPFGVVPEVGSLCAEVFFLPLNLLLVDFEIVLQFVGTV